MYMSAIDGVSESFQQPVIRCGWSHYARSASSLEGFERCGVWRRLLSRLPYCGKPTQHADCDRRTWASCCESWRTAGSHDSRHGLTHSDKV